MASSFVFGVFLLFIGLVVGGLVTALIMGRDNHQTREDEEDHSEVYQDLVHVLRHRENGNLLLEINGEIYESAETLDEKNLSRLQIIADKMDVFLGREPIETKKEEPLVSEERVKPSAEEAETPEPEMIKAAEKEEETPQPVFSSPAPVQAEAAPPESKATSMIEQIDELLQRLIPLSPIAGKNVRISEDPYKGVVVWVDLEKYEGIDDVPDKDVRIVIRAAVAEWEKQADLRRK